MNHFVPEWANSMKTWDAILLPFRARAAGAIRRELEIFHPETYVGEAWLALRSDTRDEIKLARLRSMV